jgi:hypothetical protein
MKGRPKGPQPIRLFKRTWDNPRPGIEIASLDVVAEHPVTTPMLVALTADDGGCAVTTCTFGDSISFVSTLFVRGHRYSQLRGAIKTSTIPVKLEPASAMDGHGSVRVPGREKDQSQTAP